MQIRLNKPIVSIFILLVVSGIYSCKEMKRITTIPATSSQIALVITDSVTATTGYLYCFEKNNSKDKWRKTSVPIAVVIGRHGLGAGLGLHSSSDLKNLPQKAEGDGRSPAGVFALNHVFGYAPKDQVLDVKMPYIHITEITECIDDTKSKFYNQIVSKDAIKTNNQIDWQSSEKMNSMGIFYELGVTVKHNQDPVKNGCGSCIFLHNWSDPVITTSGCTSMAPANMKTIAFWLNQKKNPVLVQLTKQLYVELKRKWRLPEIL